ncbi:hypothetical protein QFC24_004479 [Naganishia onofrii]|uniref:Uncharacterized protein n=1 Tax=Naganishia onofrii TaxID=1851511 RepID=A0ACC2XDA0_9TREE|nr:hypothetical protein QFC24_004479 [Naganishia onofrii]
MSFAIKYQLERFGPGGLKPGDVILANSPVAGGSHLPDLTVITPVFSSSPASTPASSTPEIIFFTASRGHHADIGGITGGSMPATSTALYQEGAEIVSFKMVDEGKFDGEGLKELLVDRPSRWEGCSGCRDYRSVESDLKAQVAANHKGSQLLHNLVDEYGLKTVHEYMAHIRTNAEMAVRKMLRSAVEKLGTTTLSAVDYMDDGSAIALSITIDPETGSAVFDFEGTSPEARGNWNAPISVRAHDEYAVILRQFGYRPNSGGHGKYTGGNGVIREMEFLQPIEVSMLSERRVHAPYGAEGGEPGSTGLNIQVKKAQRDDQGSSKKERRINIGGKATVKFQTGDRLVIHTPGGGGWGAPGTQRDEVEVVKERMKWEARGSLADRAAAQAAFGA